MSDPTLLLTQLDAVNMMLSSIGQAPVSSLNVSGIRDVSIAKLSLDNVTREVLLRGWNFNTDYDWPLVPDANGKILVPATVLDIDPCDVNVDVVVRYETGVQRLYDREHRTFVFTADSVDVNVTWAFPFEEVPEAARSYIATRAARIFQSQVIGSDILFRFTEQHETETYATLRRLHAKSGDKNILGSATEGNQAIYRRRLNSFR